MKRLIQSGVIFVSFFLFGCVTKRVVVSYSPDEISKALDDRSYQFLARFVQPSSGRQRELTGVVHFLRVSEDKVSADLPYFGRAYSAPIGTDGGIKFESTDFTYNETSNKRGAREIRITIQHSSVVRELNLTVFPDGNADLRIIPENRRFISYRGEVTPMVN